MLERDGVIRALQQETAVLRRGLLIVHAAAVQRGVPSAQPPQQAAGQPATPPAHRGRSGVPAAGISAGITRQQPVSGPAAAGADAATGAAQAAAQQQQEHAGAERVTGGGLRAITGRLTPAAAPVQDPRRWAGGQQIISQQLQPLQPCSSTCNPVTGGRPACWAGCK